jgi:MFS family permease
VLCAGALAGYSFVGPTAVWPFFLIALAFGAVDAMLVPSRRSIAPLVAPPDQFPSVVALWTGTFTASSIVGPVLGGFLYTVGPDVAYGVAAAAQLLAVVPILTIVYAREQERFTDRPTLSAALEGLRFVRRTPIVLAVISLDLFAVLFGGAIALIPAVASERLGVGDIAYGWLRAAPGIGAATMAIVLAFRPVQRRVGPTLILVVAIFGAGTVVFGLTRSYVVAFVALVVISAADMISMYIRGSIVPLATPGRPARSRQRGRRCVHRSVQRARRLREWGRRPGAGVAVGDRRGWLDHGGDRRGVRSRVPDPAPDRHVRRGPAADPGITVIGGRRHPNQRLSRASGRYRRAVAYDRSAPIRANPVESVG